MNPMEANGVIINKIESIREVVRQLRGLGEITTAGLDGDYFLKRGVERALQIGVEAVIDIAHRLVSLAGRPPCATGARALDSLQEMGVLKEANVYKKMVQFRNLVVHRYETVDSAILVDIVLNHLDDFDEYIREVLSNEGN